MSVLDGIDWSAIDREIADTTSEIDRLKRHLACLERLLAAREFVVEEQSIAPQLCKCGEPCQMYGEGNASTSCKACNEKNATRQRKSRAASKEQVAIDHKREYFDELDKRIETALKETGPIPLETLEEYLSVRQSSLKERILKSHYFDEDANGNVFRNGVPAKARESPVKCPKCGTAGFNKIGPKQFECRACSHSIRT